MQPYWLSRPGPPPDPATRGRFELPAGRFEREPACVEGGRRVPTAQAACLQPVQPLAKLAVEPADFPLRIRGYDLDTHLARIEADPGGFPWLAADEI